MNNEDKQGSKQEDNNKNKDSQNELLINLFKELLKKTLSKEDLLRIFEELLSEIKYKEEESVEISKVKEEVKREEVKEKPREVKEISKIPLVFTKELSPFESIVKFLRENENLRYSKIAKLLNRNPRVIWITYQRAKKKFSSALIPDYSFEIPLNIFCSKRYSILESAVKYLHEFYNLRFSKISQIFKKSYTTVHTAYARTKSKDENKKEENAE